MEKLNSKTERIRCICDFLDRGGGSLVEMQNAVNQNLEDKGLATIEVRSLRYSLRQLKDGDFEQSLSHLPESERKNLFNWEYHRGTYRWAESSLKPEFGDLEEEERSTLPFLMGILKRYETLPAVRRILGQLVEHYRLNEDDLEGASAVFHSAPTLYVQGHGKASEKNVVELAIQLLGHIRKEEVIEFNYSSVAFVKSDLNTLNYHTVMPLQIRLYDNLYYLSAVPLNENHLLTFRIDQIHGLRVDIGSDENENPIHFDRKKVEKKMGLRSHFKHVLGVWNHAAEDQVHDIRVEFFGWAASYAKRLQFHPTQTLIHTNVSNNSLVFSFKLKLKPEEFPNQPAEERSPELSFFLGRFRRFARVLSFEALRG